jgi:hypothetical protein
MNTGSAQSAWVPAGTRTDHDWEVPGVNGAAAHTVEYRRADQPASAVILLDDDGARMITVLLARGDGRRYGPCFPLAGGAS